jgi:hypothetical protein
MRQVVNDLPELMIFGKDVDHDDEWIFKLTNVLALIVK